MTEVESYKPMYLYMANTVMSMNSRWSSTFRTYFQFSELRLFIASNCRITIIYQKDVLESGKEYILHLQKEADNVKKM